MSQAVVWSGTGQDFSAVFGSEGLVIPISPAREVKYIKLWAKSMSPSSVMRVLEIEPLKIWPKLSNTTKKVGGGADGDPHFRTWDGSKFDFQ
jgi:hypothetical protein